MNTESRNKIVIHRKNIPRVKSLDVGVELSKSIQEIMKNQHFAWEAKDKLERLFKNSVIKHKVFGDILSLRNLGILFEPGLKIDFPALIDKHSKDICLFIKWEGEIHENNLYFLTRKKGIKINIEKLSHIIL